MLSFKRRAWADAPFWQHQKQEVCACGEEYLILYHVSQVSYVVHRQHWVHSDVWYSFCVCLRCTCSQMFVCPFLILSVELCIVFSLSSLSLFLSFFLCRSPFSTLWNVQFCAVVVGLSAPWRWEGNGFVVKPQRDGFLHQSESVSRMYSMAENTLLKCWLHFEETATVELKC